MKKKPVILENITVEDYAAEGKSLAHANGKVIFIENTIPGDIVDVQLYKNKKDWAEGWPLNFKSYSSERVLPFCAHFGVCGGCQWQMLPYEKQLYYKQKQVGDNLKYIGKMPLPPLMPIIGCDNSKYYRNKIEYTFSDKKFVPEDEFRILREQGVSYEEIGNESVAGFHAKGVFDKVVDIDICHLQAEPSNEIRKAVAAFACENHFSFYDMKEHFGWLRNMTVRMTTTGELMLNIVFGYEHEKSRKQLLDFILNKFPMITTLLYVINPKPNDSIFDLAPQVYFGKGHITEKLSTGSGEEDFEFRISPKSFFQTNTKQAEKLYQVVRNFAELDGTKVVYDLYCGTGSIGIFVSRGAKKIIGIDVIKEAIDDAKENAMLNNISHASFFAGDVTGICTDEFFAMNGKPDVVITDPPRAGMHQKLVLKLMEIAAPVIVYVSCNPATQARDLSLLSEKYTVEKIQPLDMFPHTHHIENIAQLKLKV